MLKAKYIPYYVIIALVVILIIGASNWPKETEDPRIAESKEIIAKQKQRIEFWKKETGKWMKKSDGFEDKIEKNETNVDKIYEEHKKIRDDFRLLPRSERVRIFAERYKRR